ncbi:MAG: LAGLIDADG family homing endonuclease [Candidatus Woesearchaeota archaeon]|jgi:intein/homing endonuclease
MVSLNPEIAELLGAHAGDGTLYQVGKNTLVWELRGALEEKEYYLDNICPLLGKIFNLKITSKFRSGGANGVWGVQTTNKSITSFFLEYGFLPGTKTYTVFVPSFILKSDLVIKRAFVRGLFDTDGCLRFDRINKQERRNYPRIEFGLASKPLRDSLKELTDMLGFRSFIWTDRKNNYRLCFAGKEMLERWIYEIQPKNPKHLKKYHIWKEQGYY